VYSGTVFAALAAVIDRGTFPQPKRIGLFSYGSGCCSEFFSGFATEASTITMGRWQISCQLETRYRLNMDEYDGLLDLNRSLMFGKVNQSIDRESFRHIFSRYVQGRGLLVLKNISGYHRAYEWV
jgi:polyketide biosynthesis 3-hydroxy-3-methylglutaryl-CoA synthase-like enzyme PksG